MPQASTKTLKYIILNPRDEINLNLFEAEKYEAAILVQQLIGTLVYYSNFGRYEPRLAKSWSRDDSRTWTFHLHPNLKCQDGETIDADSYKRSLERTLVIYSRMGGVPILSSLEGYGDFVRENQNNRMSDITSIPGIISDGKLSLRFKFDKNIKSGVLQILSFSPFGYISQKNLSEQGKWIDNTQFMSSGPYTAVEVQLGEKYVLGRNKNWTLHSSESPDSIIITHKSENEINSQAVIVDSFTNEFSHEDLEPYSLVPEYLNSVLMGNLENGYFKSRTNRENFKRVFENNVNRLPQRFGVNSRSTTFYPNQDSGYKANNDFKSATNIPRPNSPLVIEGTPPEGNLAREFAWKALEATLKELDIPHRFAGNKATFEEMTNKNYDLRVRGSSIGGGVEAWGLFVSFCSSVGINFPDPENQICELIEKYENDSISELELQENFFKTINTQSAILPVSHYGVQLSISEAIDTSSFSPLLAIMKFDQIKVK